MNEFNFSSLKDLYDRIKPALEAKKTEMIRTGYSYIEIEDIWNFLKENKWNSAVGLNLHQMVDDVLNTDSILIDNYLKQNLRNRTVYFE